MDNICVMYKEPFLFIHYLIRLNKYSNTIKEINNVIKRKQNKSLGCSQFAFNDGVVKFYINDKKNYGLRVVFNNKKKIQRFDIVRFYNKKVKKCVYSLIVCNVFKIKLACTTNMDLDGFVDDVLCNITK